MWEGLSTYFNPNNYYGFFLQHFLLCYNMAPNQFIQSITKTIWGSSQHHCLAGCKQMFWSRGGLTKHLKAAHPGYLDVHPHPLPSEPTSPVCIKKHYQHWFSFTKGFSLSFDSADLATPTDHEDNFITDSEDSRSTNPASFSPYHQKYIHQRFIGWGCRPQPYSHKSYSLSMPREPFQSCLHYSKWNTSWSQGQEGPKSAIYHPELNGM